MPRQIIGIKVSVPICGLKKGFAREYLETERFPPPSTIYGMLLSYIGEEDRRKYSPLKMAVVAFHYPEVSTILRTIWRVKSKEAPPGIGSNRKPDFQELLTGLEFVVWLQESPLAQRLEEAINKPETVFRYGGLSLGESRDLVNEINLFDGGDQMGYWLMPDAQGDIPLTTWVDHVGSSGTIWEQFSIVNGPLNPPSAQDKYWVIIQPNIGRNV